MSRVNLSRWAVTHQTLVLFLILIFGIGGALSYVRLGRAEDPSFTIKVATMTVIWPGASAAEMQNQVADPIEKKLQELPYFDKVLTYAKPSFIAMQLVFKDTTPPQQVPWLFYLMRKKLQDVRGDLPANIIGPNINDEFGDVDSVLYMVTGQGADYAQLKKIAEGMRQALLKVPDVAKVNLYGVQERKIFVEFAQAKLATLGVSPQQIFDSLAKQNSVSAAGVFETSAHRVPLRVTGALTGVEAVAETPVEVAGKVFRLGDVADVKAGFQDPPTFLARQRGEPALGIGVVMARGGNILKLGEALRVEVERLLADMPVGVEIEQIADQPDVVRHAVGEFTRSFVEALLIVLVVSFISLGLRTGIVVALSVPMVLGIVFIFMSVMGLDLQRITLGALIIALGLLVDDAIIAVEMMVVKMEQGVDRLKAATFAWDSTAFPMLTGTLVTAAGFLPVGFAPSSTGEYAGGIFWVVTIALVASWFVAVVFTPYLGVKLLPDFAKHGAFHDSESIYNTRLYRGLRRVIEFCVVHRLIIVAMTVLLFVGSIFAFEKVQRQFFPLSERPELFFQMRLPEGSAIGVTLESAKKGEALLKGDPDVATYTTYVGQGSPRFWLGLNPQLPNESFAEIVIVAKDVPARERLKAKIEGALNQGVLAEARVRVDRFNYGPPVGFPVQFRVIGSDPNEVRAIAYRVRDIVGADPAVRDPNLDWNEQAPDIRLEVDQDRARALGLTPQDIANSLQMLVSGVPVTTMRDGIDKVDVVARARAQDRADLGALANLTILTRSGASVPVLQVARLRYAHEEAILWRRNRDMAITVRADVADGAQAPDVTMRIWPKLAQLQEGLKPGYRLEIGGAVEESTKANASLAAIFPIMILTMLTLLMIQLQSFSRLILVVLTAPLGLIGAAVGLLVAAKPFGFVALLGLIALAGMIMRNTVILVDQIEEDVDSGRFTRRQAIVEATVRRARPVVLTAFAAILAMIPLSRSAFWGPMAIVIMGGLFVATFLTILFLPALYALWFRRSLDAPLRAPILAHEGGEAPEASAEAPETSAEAEKSFEKNMMGAPAQ